MFKLPKNQKLCNKKVIDRLFTNGKSISEKPFRAIWDIEKANDDIYTKVLIIVSKKRLKLAVERNFMKRRVKEAYRFHKRKMEYVLQKENKRLNLAIIYQHEKTIEYNMIETKINLLLTRLIQDL